LEVIKIKKIDLIDVNANNVTDLGFFCYMSKRKSEGYRSKQEWLKQRFSQGLRLKMLGQGQRGFIEYIPGEYAWRAINAKGFMVIHCLWVVGKSKGQGYAGRLLEACIEDARESKMKGVAVVTSKANWLLGGKLLNKYGFDTVDQAAPSFDLMVKPFGKGALPSFLNSKSCLKRHAKGLVVFRSDQCPYLDDASRNAKEVADEMGIDCKIIQHKNCRDVQQNSPSAYGVFNLVYNGELLSYHYLTRKELQKRLLNS
jgi:hypothetical protein